MNAPANHYTAEELYRAYLKARLRYKGITLLKALNDPLIYRSLCLQAESARKQQLNELQHGKPAPILQAA